MDKPLTLKELYAAYKRWVIMNPNLVTDLETVATWSSYFVAGKINKSAIVSEVVYCASKLLCLVNDGVLREAYGESAAWGPRARLRLLLTVLHYSEVLLELAARSRWGNNGKWTTATILQIFKCSSALILLYRFKELPICHPPIPPLQRKKFIEGKDTDETSNGYFTLRRSGRVIRRIDGAPPVALRDWQPVRTKADSSKPGLGVKDLMYAETLHILKPLIHLAAMRVFGTKAWKQWLVALGVDLASLKLYNRHMKSLSYEQRLEVSRRKLGLVLYLLRSPMYNGYSKNVIERALNSASNKIPMMSFICGPVIQYLTHWQEMYFYMWSS